MKRLVLRWVVGFDENNEPIYRRQNITISNDFSPENAQTVVSILDKYSKYMCEKRSDCHDRKVWVDEL